jgi:phage-related minor tail protein
MVHDMDSNDGLYVVIGGDIAPLRSALSDASRLSNNFANSLTRAFTDASLKGRALSDVLKSLAFSLSKNTLEAALAPINRAFGNSLTQLLGGAGVAASVPVPFAQGGVISSPVTFPLSGRRGLAGEAGPEAILPLARGRDGRLGVRSDSGAQWLNVTFNVTTQDAQSFRRSEGQIAAMLSRVVGRGQRNL